MTGDAARDTAGQAQAAPAPEVPLSCVAPSDVTPSEVTPSDGPHAGPPDPAESGWPPGAAQACADIADPFCPDSATVFHTGADHSSPDHLAPDHPGLAENRHSVAPPAPTAAQRRRARRAARAGRRGGTWLLVSVVVLLFGLGIAALALTARPVRLPVWLVAEAEQRLNAALSGTVAAPGAKGGLAGTSLSVGGAVMIVDRADWIPRLVIEDLRLLHPGGATILGLPEVWLAIDPGALVQGEVRLSSVRLAGGAMALRRLPDGRFDLALGGQMPALTFDTLAALLDAADAAFASDAAASLTTVEAEALTLTLRDDRAGRTWEMGDGRLTLERRETGLAMDLGLTLVGGGATPAQARLTVVTNAADKHARIRVALDRVAAPDIALQAPGLAWLGLLDAEVSGNFATSFDPEGKVATLDATLNVGAGALRPANGGTPLPFDRAALAFDYDPARERVALQELSVDSETLQIRLDGHADLPGVRDGLPDTAIAQIAVRALRVDPDGLFQAPAAFTGGAIDLRLRLAPFSVEIGQAVLLDGDRRLSAKGRIGADPAGWRVALDVALDAIGHDRLVALWPVVLVPKTRDWLVANLQEGTLSNVRAALRTAPGTEPRIALSYDFAGAGVRFMPTLPPVRDGHGYAVLEGKRYTVVLDSGHVSPPRGGDLDVSGSVFVVPDVTQIPSTGQITLHSRGTLTGTLSLLDEAPFQFLTKANQPVELGEGQVTARAEVTLPLIARAQPDQIDWRVTGQVARFRSDVLVPGRVMAADLLQVTADKRALQIAGQGTLDGVPFDATYAQPLGPGTKGAATVTGTVEMSQATAQRLRLGLPEGLISGRGNAGIRIALAKGVPPDLTLTSDLRGVGLSIPELGWSKARAAGGTLTVEAQLATPARISSVRLEAAGLSAAGTVALRRDGSLDAFRLSQLRVGDWLDAQAVLTGQGAGRAPTVALTGGRLDLRRMPRGSQGGTGGGAIALALDRLDISDTIALRDVAARLTTRGGVAGQFTARVNGGARVEGVLTPTRTGSTIALRGADAGAILSDAGIFPNARGGTLEMTLVPRTEGYAGSALVRNVRVRNTPVLAELINAISVVGLLEQLDGGGLTFSEADATFRLTSNAVEITRGAAIGASLGVSLAGLYDLRQNRLDMQGVISPIYLVNGIGAIFTRRGEGLFGFNYRLRGTPSDPQVSVNPLSILTPGMFREIFRRPPPRIGGNG